MDKMKYVSIITEWQNILLSTEGVEREYEHELLGVIGSKPIKVISGFRRSGKSFLVQMTARKLIETKVYPKENILYINFEDYKFASLRNIPDLDTVIQMFLKELSGEGKKLLIFDEIQKVNQWDVLIRTIYEKEKDTEIIITGSNSELLSSEISSHLAGRFIEIHIQPFNFLEYLSYNNIAVRNEMDYYKNKETISTHFSAFLQYGGLPEVFTIADPKAKYSYLEGILSKVILDDIVERFNVRQVSILEKIITALLTGSGNIVSPTRLMHIIQNEGNSIKNDTVSLYIEYVTKAFAVYPIDKFDWKLKRYFSVNKKYYAVDTGLINLYATIGNTSAKQLENIVYLTLRSRFNAVYYGALQSGQEIDFIVKDRTGTFYKYQVTTTLTAENSRRELSNFVLSDQHLGTGNNILLSLDEDEEEITYKSTRIQKKNLMKWLLLDEKQHHTRSIRKALSMLK